MRGMDAEQELYLVQKLQRDEGLRLKPYKDSVGKLTIGYGRNLDDKGISKNEAGMMLANDIQEHITLLFKHLPWVQQLEWPRQYVLMNMGFNLGIGPTSEQPQGKLLTFKNTLAAIQSGRYAEAADNMLKSKWAGQVGQRANELAEIMRTGVLP